jgi:hypothetical protein
MVDENEGVIEENLEQDDVPEEILNEATEMGWVPRDKFKGDPDKWVPADEFVEKGRHVLPIVLKNNERLKKELLTRDKKIDMLVESLESAQTAIKALQAAQTVATRRAVNEAIADLKAKIKDAREDGDVDTELALMDKLTELKEVKKDPEGSATESAPKKEEKKSTLSPEFLEWKERNPWFEGTSQEDRRRTKEVIRIAEDLREEHPDVFGRDFFDLVDEELAKRFSSKKEDRRSSKVESGNGRSVSSGSRKGYADMPAEARKACDDFADSLVGENKQYKTLKEWRDDYAKTYFGGNE